MRGKPLKSKWFDLRSFVPVVVSITSAIISWKWTQDTCIRGILAGVIIIIGLAGYVISQRLAERNSEKFRWQTEEGRLKIRQAITNFINQGQDTAIFSRDLTWVNDEVLEILAKKASARELTLFMPRAVALNNRLVELGAVAYYYDDLFSDPSSFDGIPRFTLHPTEYR